MISYDEALRVYTEQFFGGRKKGTSRKRFCFPFGNRYQQEQFVCVAVDRFLPDGWIKDSKVAELYLATIHEEFPPIWLSLGRKLRNGFCVNFHRKFIMLDGYHRMNALMAKGLPVKAWMPESHYAAYLQLRGE